MPSIESLLRDVAVAVALMTGAAAISAAQAQPSPRTDVRHADSTARRVVRLTDGTSVIGRVDDPNADPVVVHTDNGTLTIPRARVAELRLLAAERMHEGEYWPPNPNETRLLFAPTGRMLKQGEGYYSNTYLFFQQFAGGISSQFTLGGGLSIFPSDDFADNVFYVTPKVGLYNSDRVNVAAGVLAAIVPGEDTDGAFGIAYGVATLGSPDAHVTLGSGLGYAGGRFARDPVFMLGGEKRLSRRTSLISENYLIPTSDDFNNVVSYGLRFFGDRLSVDFALLNTLQDDAVFPGIPYVAFAVKF